MEEDLSSPTAATLNNVQSSSGTASDNEQCDESGWYLEQIQSSQYNRTLELPSGRRVSYAESGDLTGFPVIFLLGLGGHRYYSLLYDAIGKEKRLRFICIDRPGTGTSDDVRKSRRSPMYFTHLILKDFCSSLGILRFGLVGQSCGAVYALAIALRMGTLVRGDVTLISPWVTVATPGHTKLARFAHRMPSFVLSTSYKLLNAIPRYLVKSRRYDIIAMSLSNNEKIGFFSSTVHLIEAMRQLGVTSFEKSSGHESEFVMCVEKIETFGFQYQDVQHSVRMYHGSHDKMVPLAAAANVAASMPCCSISVRPEATHELLFDFDYCKQIFSDLSHSLYFEKLRVRPGLGTSLRDSHTIISDKYLKKHTNNLCESDFPATAEHLTVL